MDSHFYNDYSLPSELCSYTTPVMTPTKWVTSSKENNNLVPIFCENNINNSAATFDVVSPESDISLCTMRVATFPELLGFPEEMVAPVPYSEYRHIGLNNGISGLNFGGGDSYLQLYNKVNNISDQFGDQECCDGFMPANSKPVSLASQENWGFDQGIKVPTMEDQSTNNMKVGRYSEEERKERIQRYLKKRNQRNFNKTIKYACRKTLADRRVRVRGRFARNERQTNEDSTLQEMAPNNIDTDYHASFVDKCEQNMYCTGNVQIKYDEEEWLQGAMASLVYLPYVTAG